MIALSKEAAAEVSKLLDAYDSVIEALEKVDKTEWSTTLSVDEDDGKEDAIFIPLQVEVAIAALKAQQGRIEADLRERGIEIT